MALDDVSFRVAPGDIHALLGGNGSGKSTLIKILAGVYSADPGGTVRIGEQEKDAQSLDAEWSRLAGMSFVHQDLGLFAPLSVGENLFAAQPYPRTGGKINWGRLHREAQEVLDRLEIEIEAETELVRLRPSDQTLVAIARAMRGREEFHGGVLVLDEPTARLPAGEVDFVLGALRRYSEQGQTILFVSHRLEEVLSIADAVTVLRDGRVIESRSAQGLTQDDLVTAIAGRALANAEPSATGTKGEGALLEVRNLAGGPLREISLAVAPGEVLGVAGVVGSGRTSLLEMVFGALPREPGTVFLAGEPLPPNDIPKAIERGLCYVPEDRASQAGFMDLTVAQNLSASEPSRFGGRWWLSGRRERRASQEAVAAFGVRTAGVEAPLASLSGGNQQKVVVARAMARNPKLLLLDEPTQGVDVGARAEIYGHIDRAITAGSAALLVSSDFDELVHLSHRVIVIAGGQIVAECRRGDFDQHWLTGRIYGT
ncbi:MAG: sugar ABC transporter ATP-binding protein [Solirubrobacterales bacterium]